MLKSIFSFTVALNLSLNLMSVPFRKNLADTPFRGMSLLDCSLGPSALHQVDSAFGPHTIDLMALPFNVQVDRASRRPLRFFPLFPCARQMFSPRSFSLVRFWSFSAPKNAPFFVVVPDLCPSKFWWPLVSRNAACAFKFGSKGDTNILLFPPDLAPLCRSHALYSGIFRWFGSPPFEIALFTRLGSPRPCSSCAKSDSDLVVVILPFVSLA